MPSYNPERLKQRRKRNQNKRLDVDGESFQPEFDKIVENYYTEDRGVPGMNIDTNNYQYDQYKASQNPTGLEGVVKERQRTWWKRLDPEVKVGIGMVGTALGYAVLRGLARRWKLRSLSARGQTILNTVGTPAGLEGVIAGDRKFGVLKVPLQGTMFERLGSAIGVSNVGIPGYFKGSDLMKSEMQAISNQIREGANMARNEMSLVGQQIANSDAINKSMELFGTVRDKATMFGTEAANVLRSDYAKLKTIIS